MSTVILSTCMLHPVRLRVDFAMSVLVSCSGRAVDMLMRVRNGIWEMSHCSKTTVIVGFLVFSCPIVKWTLNSPVISSSGPHESLIHVCSMLSVAVGWKRISCLLSYVPVAVWRNFALERRNEFVSKPVIDCTHSIRSPTVLVWQKILCHVVRFRDGPECTMIS